MHFHFTGFKQKFRQTSRCALTFKRELQPSLCWQMLLWEPQISHYRMVCRPVHAVASSCLQPPIIVLWYPNTGTLLGNYSYLVALEVTYSGAEATQKYSITSHQVFVVVSVKVTVFSGDTKQLENRYQRFGVTRCCLFRLWSLLLQWHSKWIVLRTKFDVCLELSAVFYCRRQWCPYKGYCTVTGKVCLSVCVQHIWIRRCTASLNTFCIDPLLSFQAWQVRS